MTPLLAFALILCISFAGFYLLGFHGGIKRETPDETLRRRIRELPPVDGGWRGWR